MTGAAALQRVERCVRRVWASDAGRLLVLTLYYLGIVAALATLHGSRPFTPPPFVYQGF